MQFAKDEIKQRIIDTAREEFLEKGFEKASIRTITARAKTSKSNLYNYFKDKDDLFYSLLEPTLEKIRVGLEQAKTLSAFGGIESYTLEVQKNYIGAIMGFVGKNFTDVKLLLFHSQGSSLQGFKNTVVDAFTDVLHGWFITNMPDKYISRFFVRCISNFYLSILEQLMVSGTSREQAEKHMKEFVTFIYCGWQGVINKKEV